MYRPLGFVLLFTIRGRLIVKELWQLVEQAWDNSVPYQIQWLFEDWTYELPLVSTFNFQRSISNESIVNCSHELHVFVDNSQSAMCAVAYLRSVQCENVVVLFFVAKFRVAPIRARCIPKFELQAVVIGWRLSMSIKPFLPFSVKNCFLEQQLHCSSMDSVVWQTSSCFCCYSCCWIIDGSNVEQWNFIPGQIKFSDICTRGSKMPELENTDWF